MNGVECARMFCACVSVCGWVIDECGSQADLASARKAWRSTAATIIVIDNTRPKLCLGAALG